MYERYHAIDVSKPHDDNTLSLLLYEPFVRLYTKGLALDY